MTIKFAAWSRQLETNLCLSVLWLEDMNVLNVLFSDGYPISHPAMCSFPLLYPVSLVCFFLFPLLKQMVLSRTPASFWGSHWQRSRSRGSSGRLIWNSHTIMMWATSPGTKLRSPCHIQTSCAPWCWPASHIAWGHRWECCLFWAGTPAWSKRSWNGISWDGSWEGARLWLSVAEWLMSLFTLSPQLWMRLSGALQKKRNSEMSYRDIMKNSSNDETIAAKQVGDPS